MRQIRFQQELHSIPREGAYSVPQTLLAEFKGPTSKGKKGMKIKCERLGEIGEGMNETKENGGSPNHYFRLKKMHLQTSKVV